MIRDLLAVEPLAWLARGSLWLAGVFLASWVFRRQSAAWLAFFWRAALLGLLALVGISLTNWKAPAFWTSPVEMKTAAFGETDFNQSPEMLADGMWEQVAMEEEAFDLPAASSSSHVMNPAKHPDATRSIPWRALVWSVWGGGALWVLARWLGALVHRTRLARAAQKLPPEDEWHGLLRELTPSAKRPLLLRHPATPVPCTWGVLRPVILVPALADGWTREQKRLALAHELAHLRRGDSFWQTLSVFLLALHWANPLAWLAVRRWRLAEEQAADDSALASSEPSAYAALLVACARQNSNPKTTITMTPHFSMAHPSTVPQRVERILDPAQDRTPPGFFHRALFATALAACFVACLSLTTWASGQDQPKAADPFAAPAIANEERSGNGGEIAPALEALQQAEKQTARQLEESNSQELMDKLRNLIIPEVNLDQITIEDAVEFLRIKSSELDVKETDPKKRGVNFILRLPPAGPTPKIASLHLTNVPLQVAAKAVTDQAGLRMRVEPYAVIIALADIEVELYTKVYRVPPDFLSLDGGSKRSTALEVLKEAGVPFPEQASAFFSSATSTLTVRNTPGNLDLVSQFVESISARQPKMINLRAEFYQMPKADALALLDQLDSMADASAGVAKLREIAATSEKIKLLTVLSLHSRSGLKARTRSSQGRTAHPENQPSGSPTPDNGISSDFTGWSFSAEATLFADGKTLDITADFVFGAPSNTLNGEPSIGSLSTSTTMIAGQTRLVGTLSGGENEDSIILAFLKASLIGTR